MKVKLKLVKAFCLSVTRWRFLFKIFIFRYGMSCLMLRFFVLSDNSVWIKVWKLEITLLTQVSISLLHELMFVIDVFCRRYFAITSKSLPATIATLSSNAIVAGVVISYKHHDFPKTKRFHAT